VIAVQAQSDEAVGEPPEVERPEVAAISEVGGVLTPQGYLVIDPQVEYVHSSEDRFFFQGVEIVDSVLIGALEAESVSRDSIAPSFGARYGITSRLEIDFRVPFVYRDDRETITPPGGSATTNTLNASDIGDVEAGIHYQVNDGMGGWPFFIANLRGKTDTGRGPFDVDFDSTGLPTELPTGSGFLSIEPSVTVIYPTDPVVFFVNVGYQWNVEKDVDTFIPTTGQVGDVDPGDAIKGSFGMGFALNERTSFTLGYEHNYIQETDFEVDGVETSDETLQIGSFLFGFSHRWTDHVSTNLNFAIGATEDAPDVRVLLGVPISFDLLGLL
jgi:hypothetical protein